MGGLYSKILINALPIKGTVYSQYHNGLGAPRSPSLRNGRIDMYLFDERIAAFRVNKFRSGGKNNYWI